MMFWLSLALARPLSVGFVDAEHVRCQYQALEDAARCAQVVVWAEEAWAVQVDQVGFEAPLSDGALGGSAALDIYVSREAGGAGSAWVDCDGGDPNCIDSDPSDGFARSSSYVVIDPRTSDTLFQSYVHHEFAHTLQYATDYTEPFLSLWEGTAVACEHWTDPAWATSANDFGDYQATPWLSAILQDGYFLADMGYDNDSWYEYGAVAWVFFMDARYGDGQGSVGPQIWAAAAQPGATVLDAWQQLSGDWQQDLLEFTAQRARMGSEAGPLWAAFAGVQGRAMREGRPHVGTLVQPEFPPYPLGVSFYDLPAQSLQVHFEGDASVDWALLSVTAEDWAEVFDGDVIMGAGATLAVVNLGLPSFVATDPLSAASFSLELRSVAVVPDDADKGCGCATAEPWSVGWVLGWVGLGLRRRVSVPFKKC